MECVALIACSSALIFARLAGTQDPNPLLWDFLAMVVYAGAPCYLIWRGASVMDAPIVRISSFGGVVRLAGRPIDRRRDPEKGESVGG
jgi:hypothetical protein